MTHQTMSHDPGAPATVEAPAETQPFFRSDGFVQKSNRDILAENLRRSAETGDQRAAPGNWPKVFAPSPLIWDLPDPAIRGAEKMRDEAVATLWRLHARTSLEQIRCGVELAVARVEALDPAKVVG